MNLRIETIISNPINETKVYFSSVMVSAKRMRLRREPGGEDGDEETWREKWKLAYKHAHKKRTRERKMEKRKVRWMVKIFMQQTFINTVCIDLTVWNTEITMAWSLPWRA